VTWPAFNELVGFSVFSDSFQKKRKMSETSNVRDKCNSLKTQEGRPRRALASPMHFRRAFESQPRLGRK